MPSTFGTALREWRGHRHLSQLDLATEAGVSQRHLSFLETGRSKPSREMVIHLGMTLDLALRDINGLLTAAGFAEAYPETGLDDPDLDQVRSVLETLLAAHEPYPAYVIDRHWDLVLTNTTGSLLTGVGGEGPVGSGANLVRLALAPGGLRDHILNWEAAATVLLHRLEREVIHRPEDRDLMELLAEVRGYPGVADLPTRPTVPDGSELVVPLELRTPLGDLRLITTIATIGAAYDVTLEELRLETLLPADAASEALLRSLSSG